MDNETIIKHVSTQYSLQSWQVQAVISLNEEGGTIPFIARYRKEATGNLDEVAVNDVIQSFHKKQEMEKRREYILQYLEENEKLTPELKKKILTAETMTSLEDLYLPYKPRKKTLADKAIELGLEPLALQIKEKNLTREQALQEAEAFISKEVPDADSALDHAMNIVVQEISDSPEIRGKVREAMTKGRVSGKVKKGKEKEGDKYQDYFDFSENLEKIASHRIMALLRADKEKILSISVEPEKGDEALALNMMQLHFNKKGPLLLEASSESLKRHLSGSIGNEVLKIMKEKAEKESLHVFSKNLEKILLFSPFGEKNVLAIDPGIRTGCKIAVIDAKGDFQETLTIYPHKDEKEADKILPLIDKYNIQGIAIGDGTYGRETYTLVKKILKNNPIAIASIDEDGASVYSAGDTAREEFPELDVTVRGAISIGRRFQDPMAELVKIDPKSLGIGQYQHDITPSLLRENLTLTVEWAVNRVGVNLNTAGYHLLSYVAGLDKKKARDIVKYRSENEKIRSIFELKKVKGIGEKAFEQCAGFLRIKDGDTILDSTGVHPEAYDDVKKIAELYSVSLEDIASKPELIDSKKVREQLQIKELDSIISELSQKGLDPREEFTAINYTTGIETIEDIKEGMIVTGVVDNVAAFGAFIDIGIKENGLVHVSEVSNEFIKDITTALSVGDQITAKVIGIDKDRKRISLSIKQAM